MAFKEIVELNADVTVAIGGKNKKTGKKNPEEVEGYYLGKRSVANAKSRGESNLHFFKTADGNLGVWGKTDLDRKLSVVQPGTMTRVTFAGMLETPNGEMYRYTVAVDDDNVVDVSGIAGASKIQASSGFEDEGDTEEELEDTKAFKAPLDRSARVQELLKGKR